jgi:hypothetical protein
MRDNMPAPNKALISCASLLRFTRKYKPQTRNITKITTTESWKHVLGKLMRIELGCHEEEGVLPRSDDFEFRHQPRAEV